MNPLSMQAVSSRRAALLVQALPEADRAWVLQALPAAPREILQGLLAELDELALAPDPALLQELAEAPAAAQPDAAPDRLERLAGRQLQALAGVLREEPAALLLRLLAMRPWPWKNALLARLPPAQRQAMDAALPLPRAPAFEHALCEALLRRLGPSQPGASAPARRRWPPVLARWSWPGRTP